MRENLNVFVDASLIYLDDYHQREGTRLEIKWSRGHMEHRKPLSTMQFDDEVRPLTRWRDAVFGTTPTVNGIIMDHPLMLESVSEHAEQHALMVLSKHMPIGLTTDTSSFVVQYARKPKRKPKRP